MGLFGSIKKIAQLSLLLGVMEEWTLVVRTAELSKEPIAIRHWDADDGLPPGPITTIHQTRDGYLWFGMQEGLGRFDGVRCTVYDTRNVPEMSVNHISALYEDPTGALWIGTAGGGLLRFWNDRFTAFGVDQGLMNLQVSAITEDLEGVLWVGTDGGGLYWLAGTEFQKFVAEDGLEDLFVVSLCFDPSGSLWVGYKSGIRQIRKGRLAGAWSCELLGISDLSILAVDAQGVLWTGSPSGLYSFADGKLSRLETEPAIRNVQAIVFAPDGRRWVGTTTGLYQAAEGRVSKWTTAEGLAGNVINSLCLDREGSLWIGSNSSGVDQLKPARFAVYGIRQGLSHETATCIYQDSNQALWIGTERGLNRLDSNGLIRFTTADGLSANLVFTVCEDATGGIWIGTVRGLNYFKDGRFTVFQSGNGLPSRVIWCSYRDRSGNVWIGTGKGLARVVEDGKFRAYTHDGQGLSHDDVRSICEDRAGRLWVGTSYGLNLLEGERFRVFTEASPGQQFKVVLTLHADADGSLWIGTMDQGLFRHRDGQFDHFTTRQGLFDNRIHQILEDDGGHLWLTSNRGIFRVRKSDLNEVAAGRSSAVEGTVFGKGDGLESVECNGTIQPAGWKSRDGRLWFPTTKGVAVADPRRLPRNERPPLVLIEKALLDGQTAPAGPLLKVPAGSERIEIHYTGLSFISPSEVSFKFRLEGLVRAWSTNRDERVASYTHLPPGSYKFEVFACNNDGVWSEQPGSLAVLVQPFFWQTAWFRLLAVLSALGGTALLVRLWMARKHRRELEALERQHSLDRERTRIARDMHDGLGSNLVRISLLGEIAEADLNEPEAARAHIQKIASTARETVRDMDEIVWAVNPKNDTLENLANYLCHFSRELFEAVPARLKLDVPANLPGHPLSAEARHNLFLFVKEALNNAAKHARATEVCLLLRVERGSLEILISDDGQGISSAASTRKGHGMENLQTRADILGGTLDIQSEPGEGTRITLRLELE